MASSLSSKGFLLPFDVLESIFYRIPAESLNRFKLVCKRWLNLLKDNRFIYKHFDLAQEQYFIHLSQKIQIINPVTNICFSLLFSDDYQIPFKNIVMHCDGLLLCISDNLSKLVVWNPNFNQVKWILKSNGVFLSYDTFGLGYDSISRHNYKILWFGHRTCEIYEFKSDSWRILDAPLDWERCYSRRGVSVKGNMYWIAKSKYMSYKSLECFDFSTETFKSICPFPYYTNEDDFFDVAISAYKEDKLSLLHQGRYIEVWITNSVKDKIVSWIKLLVVSRTCTSLTPSDYSKLIQYFIDKNNRINFMSSDFYNRQSSYGILILEIFGKDGYKTKVIGPHSAAGGLSGYVYLPSLVQFSSKERYSH